MSKTKQKDDSKPEKEIDGQDSKTQLGSFLESNKKDHYNFYPDIDYKISSGSLNIDLVIGGFSPGVHRLVGPASAGKTSEALEIVRNFFETLPNSKAVYIKTEGRLSKDMQARSGLIFCKDAKEWNNHSVFIFECNVYETIIDLLRKLVGNNPENIRYVFIIDSADSVNLKNDLEKEIGEGIKVAGAPLLTKQFLQKLSLGMTKFGHLCFFLGQISADIQLNAYAPHNPRQVKGSGGNAVQHFSNEVLEYQTRWEGDCILEDPNARPDSFKNQIIGHICKIKISKSDKEKRFVVIEVPIKYGQTNGKSIWREREIVDQMRIWGLVEKSGSWYNISSNLREEIAQNGLSIPEKFQGLASIHAHLEGDEKLTKFLFEKFKKIVLSK